MFDFIKSCFGRKDKAYLSCKFLNNGITFMEDSVRVCCSNKLGVYLVDNYKGESIDWKKIQQQRNQIVKKAAKGILPSNCIGCVNLETKRWDLSDNKIDEIFMNHWEHCNCGCVYCIQGANGKYLQTESKPSSHYNVYSHIKELYNNDFVSPNVHVELVGGDLTVLDEADDVINLCIDKGVRSMSFHSSCIYYSKGIERALKEVQYVDMDFSLDCGSRELYKKIKRIDAFDNVIENINKYLSCSENAKNAIIAKYIIVDGLNDTVEELDSWLSLINSLGIKKAKIDVNFNKYFSEVNHSKPDVPRVYYEMYELFYKRLLEYGMEDHCWEFSKRVLKEGGIPKGY